MSTVPQEVRDEILLKAAGFRLAEEAMQDMPGSNLWRECLSGYAKNRIHRAMVKYADMVLEHARAQAPSNGAPEGKP